MEQKEKNLNTLSSPQPKSATQTTYTPRSWHFDPKTERRAQLEKDYQLLPATESDIQKAVGFYQHHPVTGYGISKVEVIYNRGFNQGFEVHLQKLQKRHNNSAFLPKWSTLSDANLRKEAYDQFIQLTTPYTDSDYPNVKLLPAWHGTNPQVLDSIFSAGYANLATTDNGYFGKGYYSAYEAEYSYRVYSQGVLILNWVASYSPLPVVNNDMQALALEGKSNYGNYDAHFVPVRPRFPDNPNETVYWPCQSMNEQQYTEMVVFESAAVLPRYLVELRSEGLNLKSPPFYSSHSAQLIKTTKLPQVQVSTEKIVSPVISPVIHDYPPLFQPTAKLNLKPSYPTIQNVPLPDDITISTIKAPLGCIYSPTLFKPEPKKILSYPEQVEQMSIVTKEQSKIHQEEVQALLKWITKGHLEEVEKLLSQNPSLGVCTGTVKDLSDRTFKNITALQYAAWCLDEEMCDVLMDYYIGAHNSTIQLKALYAEPGRYSTYGDHYDIKPLILKTKTYVKKYSKWSDDQCCQYWQKEVGGEQRKCPAWLIYAWSEEGKNVAWAKQDFSQKVKREYGENRLEYWFTQSYYNNEVVLGSKCAIVRGQMISSGRSDKGPRLGFFSWHTALVDGDMICQGILDKLVDERLAKLKSLSETELKGQAIATPVKK